MTRIMGIDPGKANGYAIVLLDDPTKKLWLEHIGTESETQLYEILGRIGDSLDELVVEDFLNRPQKARSGAFDWSANHTSQVIGALKLWAIQTKTPLVLQQPAQKVPGYAYLRKQYQKGRRDVHHFDALAHVAFRLVTHYKIPPPQLQWSTERTKLN